LHKNRGFDFDFGYRTVTTLVMRWYCELWCITCYVVGLQATWWRSFRIPVNSTQQNRGFRCPL